MRTSVLCVGLSVSFPTVAGKYKIRKGKDKGSRGRKFINFLFRASGKRFRSWKRCSNTPEFLPSPHSPSVTILLVQQNFSLEPSSVERMQIFPPLPPPRPCTRKDFLRRLGEVVHNKVPPVEGGRVGVGWVGGWGPSSYSQVFGVVCMPGERERETEDFQREFGLAV